MNLSGFHNSSSPSSLSLRRFIAFIATNPRRVNTHFQDPQFPPTQAESARLPSSHCFWKPPELHSCINGQQTEHMWKQDMWKLTTFRGFAKGWFPKGWFRRMFPRNENRNEGTFAKTTLLETALLSPNDPFWCWQKGGFQKGGFGGCSPGTKTGTRVRSPKPPFYETALLSPSELSWALPWTPSWDVSWGLPWGSPCRAKTGKWTLVGALVGTLVGALVGAFVGPLVGTLVDPLVGSNFAVRVLCACLNKKSHVFEGCKYILRRIPGTKKGECNCIKKIMFSELKIVTAYRKYAQNNL